MNNFAVSKKKIAHIQFSFRNAYTTAFTKRNFRSLIRKQGQCPKGLVIEWTRKPKLCLQLGPGILWLHYFGFRTWGPIHLFPDLFDGHCGLWWPSFRWKITICLEHVEKKKKKERKINQKQKNSTLLCSFGGK